MTTKNARPAATGTGEAQERNHKPMQNQSYPTRDPQAVVDIAVRWSERIARTLSALGTAAAVNYRTAKSADHFTTRQYHMGYADGMTQAMALINAETAK